MLAFDASIAPPGAFMIVQIGLAEVKVTSAPINRPLFPSGEKATL